MTRDTVRENFSFLYELGFRELGDEHSSNVWTTILSLGELRLRFTNDRADWFVDIGFSRQPANWYALWDVLKMLQDKGILHRNYKPTNKLRGLHSVLRSSIERILEIDLYKHEIANLTSL